LFLFLFQLDVIWSLLTGRLVREKVDPAVLHAVESQVRTTAPHLTCSRRWVLVFHVVYRNSVP
jgi:hypothetical protein